jgi:CelD/BcsL family acetyltransferase involved in cellulose biosynthesis
MYDKTRGPDVRLIVQTKHLQTTRVQHASDLDAYLEAWSDLANGVPTRSPEWLLVWWQFYATSKDELCVLLFHESGGALIGLAPLFIRPEGEGLTVRLLGSGSACTNHTSWLAASGWEKQVSCAVAQFLIDLKAGWNLMLLESIDADDVQINTTVAYLEKSGCFVRRTPLTNCWRIALPSTWSDYVRMLSKSHRKRCIKMQRDYFESGRVQIRHVTGETDFYQGFEILLRLHAARWGEEKTPTGVFSDPVFHAFHETVARQLLDRKQLRLAWLEFNGTPIAAEYQFVGQKTVYAYQAGMAPSVTEFSAGNLSLMASIQFAIAQGCETFDLLRGNEPYKAHWRATPTACYDIRIWPSRISGRMAQAQLFIFKVRRWLKRRLPHRLFNPGRAVGLND